MTNVDSNKDFETIQLEFFYQAVEQVSDLFDVKVSIHQPTQVNGEIQISVECEEKAVLKLLERKVAQWQFENSSSFKQKFLRIS